MLKKSSDNIGKSLSHDEMFNLLRIIRTKRIGINNFYLLYRVYKDFQRIVDNLEVHFARVGHKIKIFSESDAKEEYQKVLDFNANFISFLDSNYPQSLKKVVNYPPLLTVKGNMNILNKKEIISIVGARNHTIMSAKMAEKFTAELGAKGIINVSGFARGIDSIVHSTSIANKIPTIGVLGCGINTIYPSENKSLYQEILKNKGLFISIFPFSSEAYPYNFPIRNKIIAGLGNLGTLVVEASKKSGTLITAQYALDFGYDVFAIPGCPMDQHFTGTNQLIKQGAQLVESVDDILCDNNLFQQRYIESDDLFTENIKNNYEKISVEVNKNEISEAKKLILNSLSFIPTTIEEIVKYTGIYLDTVLISLLELSLKNEIKWVEGRKVILNFNYE